MKKILKYLYLFYFGGTTYVTMEVFFRERSHWSMFILGGICFLCLGYINRFLPWETPLTLQMLIGTLIITTLELITGFIVNVHLGWHVWDYSNVPLNFYGQICLKASIGWYFISVFGIVLDDYLRYWFFHEDKPKYKIL